MVHRSSYVPLLLIAGLVAAAVAVLALPGLTRSDTDALLREVSEARVGGGRFFRSSREPFDSERYKKTLTDAELFLLSAEDSVAATHLRALIDAGSGRLRKAAETLQKLSDAYPEDAGILNDFGVVYLGLGEEGASNYFKAAALFERSAAANPRAPAPRFNAELALRKVGIDEPADRNLKEYRRLESPLMWKPEPASNPPPTASSLIDRLNEYLSAADTAVAKSLLDEYPLEFRKAALDYALKPPEGKEFDESMAFALSHLGNAGSDMTAKAILAPLQTVDRARVMNSRRLVQTGIAAYLKGRVKESLDHYDEARTVLGPEIPEFDNLWIKLKRADTLIRNMGAPGGLQDIAVARSLIDEVVAESRARNFHWLEGQALVSKSAASTNTLSYDQILLLLQEAVDRLSETGTPEDLARPLNYLATLYSLAGDSEKSLNTVYRGLRMTPSTDLIRRAQLYWLAGLQLSRMGFTTYAKALEQQAVTMAYASHNDGIIASIVPYLAFHHAREGDYGAAEKYLEETEISRGRMEAADGRQLTDLGVNLLCSQIMTGKGELQAAQRCLMENLEILNRQERAAPDFFAETLLQLAEIDAARSQVNSAREYFRRAIEVIEDNDAYLATTVLRMPFESQRRDIYDLAIRFEYDQGSRDSAWSYLQRYRSKLFLEFLKQMNSSVAGVLDRAIDRDKVQERIPADVQVLEYVMLENRLLVWLVSHDRFDSISIPVSRRELEEKISAFLTQINRKADIERQSSELYKLLIAPIEDRLDPAKKLAIVPDLALHRLNFPALYSDQKNNFLIQQYIILESPNLTTLLSGGPIRPSRPSRPGRPGRSNAYSFGARTDSVGATLELGALGQIYEGIHTFNGQSALKPAFLSSLGDAAVFHYAGHSQDAADPLRSSVLLDGEREGPNSVTAFEISKRKMPANSVVVLASCDSSVGNSRDGIGMRGLTSAFLISGAGSVVGSLWLVESESTSRLVLDFHRDFAKNGTPVAVALRNAQLAFIAEGLHPYYWSGFVVTGNASALR